MSWYATFALPRNQRLLTYWRIYFEANRNGPMKAILQSLEELEVVSVVKSLWDNEAEVHGKPPAAA
ncbi:MAG: hypothetical protein WCH39_22300 [Schlesneria sp.]